MESSGYRGPFDAMKGTTREREQVYGGQPVNVMRATWPGRTERTGW